MTMNMIMNITHEHDHHGDHDHHMITIITAITTPMVMTIMSTRLR